MLFQRPDKLELVTGEMYAETRREVDVKPGPVDGEATMEGVEHIGQYVYDMQTAKFEAMKANGGALPTREVDMGDGVDEDEDRDENVLIPEEEAGEFDEEEEDGDSELEVKSSGRHMEVKATSSVRLVE